MIIEFSNLSNLLKKSSIALLLTIAIVGGVSSNASAASVYVSNHAAWDQYSWCGVWIFQCGVVADYVRVNGTSLTYSSVVAKHKTGMSWGVKDKSAKWIIKGTTYGLGRSYGTFYQGISTQYIDLTISSWDESCDASCTLK